MNIEEHVRGDIVKHFSKKTRAAESSNHKYHMYLTGIKKNIQPNYFRSFYD